MAEITGDGIKKKLKGDKAKPNSITGSGINEIITGGTLEDTIRAGAGDDVVKGGTGDDLIWGDAGNDKLYGGAGSNKYTFSVGDGNDTIFGGGGIDTIELKNIDTEKLQLVSLDAKNVLIKYSDTDSICLSKYYSKNSIANIIVNDVSMDWTEFLREYPIIITGAGKGKVKGTKFDDTISATGGLFDKITAGNGNDLVYGNEGNDKLYGGNGDDTLYGGVGNDSIYGQAGTNTFVFGEGDGQDTVFSGKGIDTIKFDESVWGNLKFEQGVEKNKKDLVIKYNEGRDSVTVKKYFVLNKKGEITGVKSSVKNFIVGGQTYNLEEYAKELATLSVIMDITGTPEDDTYMGSRYNDTIRGAAGNDLITGRDGNDSLFGDAGNDTIFADIGNDTVAGGTGNDEIHGGSGNSKYVYNVGDGWDTIVSGTGNDTVQINSDEGWYRQDKIGNDLVIKYSENENDKITLKDYFTTTHSVKLIADNENEEGYDFSQQWVNISDSGEIAGTVYNDDISGSSDADTITAGQVTAGQVSGVDFDRVAPYRGDDVINVQEDGRVHIGIGNTDGNDTINGAAGADEIVIQYNASALIYGYQNGDNYIIVRKYNNGAESVTALTTITDFVLADYPNIIKIDYNDVISDLTNFDVPGYDPATSDPIIINGTFNDESDDDNTIVGGTGGDTITTGSGDDNINSGNGDDVINTAGGDNNINGGAGDDIITVGGVGDNTINGGAGDDEINVSGGANTIIGGGGNDTINVNGGNNDINLTGSENSEVNASGGDSTVTGGDSTNIVNVDGSESGNSVNISGSDGSENVSITGGSDNNIDLGGGDDNVTISGGTNDVVLGDGDDNVVVDGSGTSTITGGDGSDTIVVDASAGDSSAVTIYGGRTDQNDSGSNTIIVNAGDSEVYAGSEGDSIVGAGGNITIHGGVGNDTLDASYAASATIFGHNGDDVITGSLNADSIKGQEGNDTIYSNGGNDTILGEAGNDLIVSQNESGSETYNVSIAGGIGYDTIQLNSNNQETLVFNNGDGNDVIENGTGIAQDILDFSRVSPDDLYVEIDPENSTNIYIKYNNGLNSVKLVGALDAQGNIVHSVSKILTSNPSQPDGGYDLAEFIRTRNIINFDNDDGVNYSGTPLDENINGTSYNDTLTGAAGNDTVDGADGNDIIYDYYGSNTLIGGLGDDTINVTNNDATSTNTLIFNVGDGVDTLNAADDSYNTKTTLKFDISSYNDLEIKAEVDSLGQYGLSIKYSQDDKVFLKNYFYNDMDSNSGNVNIADINGNLTPKTLTDLLEERHIIFARYTGSGIGTLRIEDIDYYDENDYNLYISGRNATAAVVQCGQGNDTITTVSGLSSESGYETKLSSPQSIIYKFSMYGSGDDVIVGSNVKTWAGILFDYVEESTSARVNFLNGLDCRYSGDGNNDLVITYGEDILSSITVKDFKGNSSMDRFLFFNSLSGMTVDYSFRDYLFISRDVISTEPFVGDSFDNEKIYGTEGDDTINPGGGKYNMITPDAGNDTIVFTKQYLMSGALVITENTIDMGTDTLADVLWYRDTTDRSNLVFGGIGSDLIINAAYHDNDLNRDISYTRTVLKDYFVGLTPDSEDPTFMNIKIGDGLGENAFKISDVMTVQVLNHETQSDTVNGTLFNDDIQTSNDIAQEVFAGRGNDFIRPFDTLSAYQADTIHGGVGNDTISYIYSAELDSGLEVYGDAGDDSISISAGTAYGGEGSDYIEAVYTSNPSQGVIIYGGQGDDTLVGGYDTNIDSLYGGFGANRYELKNANTLAQTSTIYSISDRDVIAPNATHVDYSINGDDLVIEYKLGTEADTDKVVLNQWKNNPVDYVISYNESSVRLYDDLRSNYSALDPDNDIDFVNGTEHSAGDRLIKLGSSGDDVISAVGTQGNTIGGGLGNDSLIGGAYSDTILGGEGNDTISGGSGNNFMNGGLGNDTIHIQGAMDTVYGGAGADLIDVTGNGANWIYTGTCPDDVIADTENLILDKDKYEILETFGSVQNGDTVIGGDGNDRIFAYGENAQLSGGNGDDSYHILLGHNNIDITDVSGNNTLFAHCFGDYISEANIAMNVRSDGSLDANGVYVLDYNSYYDWMNEGRGEFTDTSRFGGVRILSSIAQFGEIRDSYSEASSQYSLTGASIDQFRQEIAQWLTSEDRNYADVQSVLTSGGDDARTLMAMFDDFNAKSGSNSGWTQISNS